MRYKWFPLFRGSGRIQARLCLSWVRPLPSISFICMPRLMVFDPEQRDGAAIGWQCLRLLQQAERRMECGRADPQTRRNHSRPSRNLTSLEARGGEAALLDPLAFGQEEGEARSPLGPLDRALRTPYDGALFSSHIAVAPRGGRERRA